MDTFWHYWHLLTQGARDNVVGSIIGGIFVAGVLTTVGIFYKSIGAGFKRLFRRGQPPAQSLPPKPQEVVVRVELPPSLPAVLPPALPQPPAPVAPARVAAIPSNLVVPFVARRDTDGRDILGCLREELQPRKGQLVVLWGAGGVGKTTLAAEAARALVDAFTGRIVWTSALGRADYTLSTLLDEIATQLDRTDLRPLAPDPKAETVRALLTQAPTLVVLDNFETVAEAEQPRLAEFLMHAPASPLITTRQKIDAAYNVKIDAMSLAEARAYLQLLIAQTNDRDTFAQLDHERIISTAARNPLLLQWVVAQIDGAQDPAAVLEDLTHGAGDAADRVFTRSFNLPQLGDDGRAALLALSLFTPSASREALAEVAGFKADVPRLNAAVKRLAALWLVKTTDAGKRLALEGLSRQLTLARLQKDAQADNYRRRFVAHFLRYAKAHRQPAPEDYDALEVERENLLNAAETAFTDEDWQSVLQLAYALTVPIDGMLFIHGYWDEAWRIGGLALSAARSSQSNRDIASWSHNIGMMYQSRGEFDEARRSYNESLEIEKKLGEQRAIANTLHQLGWLAQDQGEFDEARRFYDESLEIKQKLGDQRGIAFTLHELGRLARKQGKFNAARQLYTESLEIAKKLGDQSSIAIILINLAVIAKDQGEFNEARRLYDEGLEINKKLGNQSGIAVTLHQLGLLAEKEGDRAEAVRLLRAALSIFERLKSADAEVARRNLARVEAEGE